MRAWRVAGVVLAIVVLVGGPFLLVQVFKSHLGLLSGTTGYFVALAIGIGTSATIFLPTPTLMPLVVEIAHANGIFWVAGAYAAASALGEGTGYLGGRIINKIPAVEQSGFHRFLERVMRGRWRTAFILMGFAAIPSPYDLAGIVAGNGRYPFLWFWCATFIGRWVKYLYFIPLWEEIEDLLSNVSWLSSIASLLMTVVILVVVVIPNRKALSALFWKFSRSPRAE
ncbi:MAG: hypothetical protein Q7R55_01430 [Candidatus Wildermuthbacteria bacterium]|nr:hypothetical protein [Candidatus Wildermuthbacteria bacterium]